MIPLTVSACCVPLVLFATACGPSIDVDLDLDPGPVIGERGNVTFNFVDGCPGADVLFGCPETLPNFAIGSQARFVIGSVTGNADDEARLRRAKARTADRAVMGASRDADGLLFLDSFGAGATTIQIVQDGEVLDTIRVEVAPIVRLDAGDSAMPALHLVGTTFPAAVTAYGPANQQLYAHGAIATRTVDGLALDPDRSGYFTTSEQFAVTGDTPGYAKLEVWTDTVYDSTQFQIVTRDDITEVTITEITPTAGTSKIHLAAGAKIDGRMVNGGPLCDWRVVSGGGPGVALSSAVGDAFTTSLFVLYDSAIVFGSGDTVVECRANDRVVAQHTIQFAP